MSEKTIDRFALASAILVGCMLAAFLMESFFPLIEQNFWHIKLIRSIPKEVYFVIGVGAFGLSLAFAFIVSMHMFRKEHRFRRKPLLLTIPAYLIVLYICVGLVFVSLNQK